MELIALGYLGGVFWLLKEATLAQKRWIGGAFSLLIAILSLAQYGSAIKRDFSTLAAWNGTTYRNERLRSWMME